MIPGWGRSPGEGNGYLLQYSCLDNSRDRGALQATVLGVAELKIIEQSEWLLSKSLQAINAGEGVEKREPSYTAGGNAN